MSNSRGHEGEEGREKGVNMDGGAMKGEMR